MRTTVSLDPDVVAELERVRRERELGLSEAVNLMVRRGMANPERSDGYVHRSAPLGLRVDVSNVGEVLDLLDGD